jgi:hypothetical protein
MCAQDQWLCGFACCYTVVARHLVAFPCNERQQQGLEGMNVCVCKRSVCLILDSLILHAQTLSKTTAASSVSSLPALDELRGDDEYGDSLAMLQGLKVDW